MTNLLSTHGKEIRRRRERRSPGRGLKTAGGGAPVLRTGGHAHHLLPAAGNRALDMPAQYASGIKLNPREAYTR